MFLNSFLATMAALPSAAAVSASQIVELSQVHGATSEVETLRHQDGVLSFLGPITNAQVDAVRHAYPQAHRGVFIRDTQPGPTKGFSYLFATGSVDSYVSDFEILDPKLLPPSLGITEGESMKEYIRRKPRVFKDRFRLLRQHDDSYPSGMRNPIFVKKLMPALNRYERCSRYVSPRVVTWLKRPEEKAGMIGFWQAQALSQLFGEQGLMQTLFGLAGVYYVDLPTESQVHDNPAWTESQMKIWTKGGFHLSANLPGKLWLGHVTSFEESGSGNHDDGFVIVPYTRP